ncbi:MAG: hypothetical protein L6Q34_12565 [Nitrospira sp.]|nr:MAG: hypothetical protein UZ03_NOB001001802 [Nitrospira sp. OLB3]MCK6494252.1 hypothetical protein [Nitrospira sp.]MEB2340111.1 hypothetical protein [Nitrospirales bacterium]QOJ33993.1 MAG: hypothetical protein HRU82_03095 [Nitrospira sp.]
MNQSATAQADQDVRCLCGRLTARIEKRGVVVKCHRCGELVVIALADLKAQLKRAEQ